MNEVGTHGNVVLGERHDIVILFDVRNGNPNGDPDAGNMPRLDPQSTRGLVSDVCLKRKIRNFVGLCKPQALELADGKRLEYGIHVSEGSVLGDAISKAYEDELGKKPPKKKVPTGEQEKTHHKLCRSFFDIRAFGAVLGTEGPLKGSFYGQVRGPVQITFAQSIDKVMALDVSITRCAVASVKELKAGEEAGGDENRTMGRKHVIPYALYRAHAYISPAFAERTGFCYADLDLFFRALGSLFEHDRSAARGEMVVREVFDFEHVGVGTNDRERTESARLGCAPAHRLLEKVTVERRFEGDFPDGYDDYAVRIGGKAVDDAGPYPAVDVFGFQGVRLHRRV